MINPFGFAGGVLDSTGLLKFGMRYHDPAIARWTQEDSQSGPNLHMYAGDNPVNNVDPDGADWWNRTTWNWQGVTLAAFGCTGAVTSLVGVFGTSGPFWVAAATAISAIPGVDVGEGAAFLIVGALACGVGAAIPTFGGPIIRR